MIRMKRTGFLPLFLLLGGLLGLSAVPECRSEEFPASLNNLSHPYNSSAGEQEMLQILNRHRIRQGLQPLDLDENLSRIARNHSRDMARQGFISHEKPSGNLQTRLNRAGYTYETARENLASARTVRRAHKALLSSSPHKKNILAKDVTRVGIGIVHSTFPCEGYLYITQIFTAPREEYHPSMVQNLLESRIDEIRQLGGGAMDPDPLLATLASRSLQSLNVRYDRKELRNLLAASVSEWQEKGNTQLSQMEVSVQLVHNPKNLSIPASNREGQARKYGSAVRQIVDNRNQPAFLVLTLLGITR